MSAASHTMVVVVDDDDDLRRYISLAVEFDGRFDVVASAGTAHAGIREVAEHRPDAVLVDLTLPDIAGYGELGVVTAMHDLIPRGRVVVFTGRSDEGLEGRVMRAGGTALVTKGADAAAFIGALLASGRFGAGTDVDVRSTFNGTWQRGFVVVGADELGYWLRRGDGSTLPAQIAHDRVRPESSRGRRL